VENQTANHVSEFVASIPRTRYQRGVVVGYENDLYSIGEQQALDMHQKTDRDVDSRMPIKTTSHYIELAKTSPALQRTIKAEPHETLDLSGDDDPGAQISYSPVPVLLH